MNQSKKSTLGSCWPPALNCSMKALLPDRAMQPRFSTISSLKSHKRLMFRQKNSLKTWSFQLPSLQGSVFDLLCLCSGWLSGSARLSGWYSHLNSKTISHHSVLFQQLYQIMTTACISLSHLKRWKWALWWRPPSPTRVTWRQCQGASWSLLGTRVQWLRLLPPQLLCSCQLSDEPPNWTILSNWHTVKI